MMGRTTMHAHRMREKVKMEEEPAATNLRAKKSV